MAAHCQALCLLFGQWPVFKSAPVASAGVAAARSKTLIRIACKTIDRCTMNNRPGAPAPHARIQLMN
jgi:hypothetical protein